MAEQHLEPLLHLNISEVFEMWRDIEEDLAHWKPYWQTRGFKSWEEWRRATHAAVLTADLRWTLYHLDNPLEAIPDWRGGMFHSWNEKFYPAFPERPPRFKDLAFHPGLKDHPYIRDIAHDFSIRAGTTVLTALRLPNRDISDVEGMHRCCGIATLAAYHRPMEQKVDVVIADWPSDELPRLGIGWKKD